MTLIWLMLTILLGLLIAQLNTNDRLKERSKKLKTFHVECGVVDKLLKS